MFVPAAAIEYSCNTGLNAAEPAIFGEPTSAWPSNSPSFAAWPPTCGPLSDAIERSTISVSLNTVTSVAREDSRIPIRLLAPGIVCAVLDKATSPPYQATPRRPQHDVSEAGGPHRVGAGGASLRHTRQSPGPGRKDHRGHP